jgi:hypothetical protein
MAGRHVRLRRNQAPGDPKSQAVRAANVNVITKTVSPGCLAVDGEAPLN